MLLIVNYHYVRPKFDAPFPGIHGITPAQFEAQVRLLSTLGEFISGEDVRRAAAEGKTLPARAILITFDDGFREQYEHAWPVLERLGVPAMFFLNSRPLEERSVSCVHQIHILRSQSPPEEFGARLIERAAEHGIETDESKYEALAVAHYRYDTPAMAKLKHFLNIVLPLEIRERAIDDLFRERFGDDGASMSESLYMSAAQIADLASRGMIGNHGHEHIPLGQLSAQALREQLDRCSAFIERVAGRRPFAVSYPYGSHEATPAKVAGLARELGLGIGITMERAANFDLQSPLFLARIDNNDAPLGKACAWKADELFDVVPRRKWFLEESKLN